MAMYTNSFVRCSRFGPNLNAVVRGFSVDSGRKWLLHPSVKYLCLIGGSLVALSYARHRHQPKVHALQLRKMYSVVQFIEKQKFNVMAVPSAWVKKSCLYWPKLANSKIEKLRVSGQDFDGPTNKIPVIVHKRFKELRHAEESAEALSKREVSDVDGKKKRLKPTKTPKSVPLKDYNKLVEEFTRKKPTINPVASENNSHKTSVSTSKKPAYSKRKSDTETSSDPGLLDVVACDEAPKNLTAVPSETTNVGSTITSSPLPTNCCNGNDSQLITRPHDQLQVAAFAHQSSVQENASVSHQQMAGNHDVVVFPESSGMAIIQLTAANDERPFQSTFSYTPAVGQEGMFTESPAEYYSGSSHQVKGMSPSGFSQMDTEMQMDNEHLYAEQNDVSNLQIVGTMSYEQMKADLKVFIESTIEKSIEKCFSSCAAEAEIQKRNDIEEIDYDDRVEKHQPIDNEEELGAWNIKLNSKSLCRKYWEYFSKIIIPNSYNGKGDNACYTVVDCLFTRDFWTKLTWTGVSRGNKSKKGFREYGNVTQILCKIMQIGDPLYTAKSLEVFCKNRLFRYSKSRSASQKLRKSACRPNRARKLIAKSKSPKINNATKTDERAADDSHDSDDPMNVSHDAEEPSIGSAKETDETDIDSTEQESDDSL